MGGAGAVYVDLPLDDPGTVAVAEALLAEGYRLAGIAPRCIARDDERVTEDALRFAAPAAAVDLAAVVAEGALGERLLAVAAHS